LCFCALKIIAAIEDPPVIVKISAISAYLPAPRPVPQLAESIYSRQSVKPKPLSDPSRWKRSLSVRASGEIVTLAGDPTSALSEPTEAKPRISVRSPMIETLAG
jgi:hypothetical protein